ncbi:MAG: prolipoprotein diacylglyceryl transferase [Clostridia bacterium]|nr:prolipoprotein diacylglyceryl transferase [Clostridia bacterium]
MNPVAFEVFGLEVRWYGIFIATAMFLGSLLFLKNTKKAGYLEDDIYDIILLAFPSAIVGARLYYVLFNWSYYSGDIMRMINIRGGGLAIHGGLIGGFLSAYLMCRHKKLDFADLVDRAAPLLPMGQAIGRWGNYTNGEAHGGPTNLPWAIPVDGQMVHPTFLYESIWNFGLFLFLLWYGKRKNFKGELLLIYMGVYSVGRFFIEGLRTDSLMLGPIRMAQFISLVFIAISMALWYYLSKRNKVK